MALALWVPLVVGVVVFDSSTSMAGMESGMVFFVSVVVVGATVVAVGADVVAGAAGVGAAGLAEVVLLAVWSCLIRVALVMRVTRQRVSINKVLLIK